MEKRTELRVRALVLHLMRKQKTTITLNYDDFNEDTGNGSFSFILTKSEKSIECSVTCKYNHSEDQVEFRILGDFGNEATITEPIVQIEDQVPLSIWLNACAAKVELAFMPRISSL